MIDAGLGYVADAATAIRVAREFERLGIYWLEEPFEPDEYEAYAELADTVELRIAAGEQDATWWGFRELIERAHVDVVQPDVTRCGGITETLRIARARTRARGRDRAARVEEWHHQGGLTPLQRRAAGWDLAGVLRRRDPINTALTEQRLPIEEDGCVAVPSAPGLGVDLDEDVLESLRIDR